MAQTASSASSAGRGRGGRARGDRSSDLLEYERRSIDSSFGGGAIKMAVSRWTAWVAAGLLARLHMIAFLLMSVRFVLANHTDVKVSSKIDYYKLQSNSYVRCPDLGRLCSACRCIS